MQLDLIDIVHRAPISSAVRDGSKIPWNDPDFSRRMLREHLTQDHDAASRRSERIDRHVAWIHDAVLAGNPSRVLDLGCGPGFYSDRLTKLGHRCVGIDFSPASIEYARERASSADLARGYALADILTTEFGAGFDLAMVLFGELNAFARSDAANIVRKAHRAIAPGGKILLEVHTLDAVREMGRKDPTWHSSEHGLFSDSAFICLTEQHWDENTRIATQRFLVIDPKDGRVTRHAQSLPAYTDEEYVELLESAGFTHVSFHATMGEDDEQPNCTDDSAVGGKNEPPVFVIVTAKKPGRDES